MSFIQYITRNKAVICGLKAKDWQDAILSGGKVLLDQQGVTPGYLKTIVDKCKANGPYIVIAPGIAMPHARPEEGARSLCYGIVTLAEPVVFGDPDNDPISLLIFMAAASVREHNEQAVSQIADICDDEDLVASIMNAKSDKEILALLKGAQEKI